MGDMAPFLLLIAGMFVVVVAIILGGMSEPTPATREMFEMCLDAGMEWIDGNCVRSGQ